MKKILVLNVGTFGDLAPLLALGRGLIRRGYQVAVGTDPIHKEVVINSALSFEPIGGIDRVQFLRIVQEMGELSEPVERERFFINRFLFERIFSLTMRVTELSTQYDSVVGGSLIALAMRNIPFYVPKSVAFFFSPGEPVMSDYFRLSRNLGWQVLIASSSHLFQTEDFDSIRPLLTGYWVEKFLLPGLPTGELERFLESEKKPLFLSLGSLGTLGSLSLYSLVRRAVRAAGQRIILQTEPLTILNGLTQDELQVTALLDHSVVFPRVSCVLHHGGAGTTGAVLRAGVPCVVLPSFADQFGWASVLERLGVSAGTIGRGADCESELTHSIRRAVYENSFRKRAADLANLLCGEDGVGEAIRKIEARASGKPPLASPPSFQCLSTRERTPTERRGF